MDMAKFTEFSQKCSKKLPNEIDFCSPSDEKWNFAETLLSVLEKNIKEIPDEIFNKNGFRREDVLFFATMGDGDYIEEMIETSVKMFNAEQTLEAYGLIEVI